MYNKVLSYEMLEMNPVVKMGIFDKVYWVTNAWNLDYQMLSESSSMLEPRSPMLTMPAMPRFALEMNQLWLHHTSKNMTIPSPVAKICHGFLGKPWMATFIGLTLQ